MLSAMEHFIELRVVGALSTLTAEKVFGLSDDAKGVDRIFMIQKLCHDTERQRLWLSYFRDT